MALTWLRAEQFRCLQQVELEFDPRLNLLVGPNASGKTSLLEAAFFLGRGRSFRSRRLDALIRQGQKEFLLAGRCETSAGPVQLGVRGTRGATELRVGGAAAQSAAALAEYFPAQVIDPEIHKLLEEGPGRRRRFLDWGVFHVEPTFLGTWQRYHRALKQRNAALKQAQPDRGVLAWDQELVELGESLVAQREAYLERLRIPLEEIGQRLLGAQAQLVHDRGWDPDLSLQAALEASRDRDRRYRATQCGPHRGDVRILLDEIPAKDRVSRGQQKLLAAGLTLAQLRIQEQEKPGRSALMLDDPAAELDQHSLEKLLAVVRDSPAQLFVTSLRAGIPGLPEGGRLFHVEQGQIRAA